MGQPRRPRISVIVPVYDVEGYLAECLESVLGQSVTDIEVVAVDDGSTDSSPEVLERYADRDPRLRIVRQANAGLGAARNTGVEHATGEFLWFVDSDDVLAPGALDALLSPLLVTGSDLATGNVWRLTADGTVPARFLAPAFRRTRLRTHVRRFPPLLADRVAWNKLFRRDFWDRHGFRFPTGVHYEDQYVTLPAHYLARSVDVVARHVYLWRVRADGERSITQQRTDPSSMLDRVRAVEHVSRFLAGNGWQRDKQRYDESAVTHDLRYFLEAFVEADDDYRSAFLDAANEFLDTVDVTVFRSLPAVRRVEWELVRRRAADELVEVLRAELGGPAGVTAVRSGRRWYVDLPVRGRADLPIPDDLFRARRELRLHSQLTSLTAETGALRLRGVARIALLPGAQVQSLRLVAVPLSRGRPMAIRTHADPDGHYEATIRGSALGRRRGRWRLVLVGRAGSLRRVAVYHDITEQSARRVATLLEGGSEATIAVVGRGELLLTSGVRPPVVTAARLDGAVLELNGDAGDLTGADARLLVIAQEQQIAVPLHLDRGPAGRCFVARLPIPALAGIDAVWRVAAQVGAEVRDVVWGAPPVEPEGVVVAHTAADGYAGLSLVGG